jgi:excisionase family DNA binding protein
MEEAAELFGVSIKTFIKLLKEEKVPGRKIGREWRFSRQALISWLAVGDSQAYSASEGDVKGFFNEVAPKWEEISKNYDDQSLKNKMIELNILKKPMTLIDLGAGDGFISRFAARFVQRVIAIDISGEMLRELQRKAKSEGIQNIEVIESDALDVPLADSSIDIVCANMFLHHIEQPELAIQEMHRLVKPGGTVFLADFYAHSDRDLMAQMHDVWPGFDPDQIVTGFQKTGFERVYYEAVDKCNGMGPNQVRNGAKQKVFVLVAVK